MLLSLALIIFCGFLLGGLFQKLKLPALLGMILTGILLGPYTLNQIDPAILNVSGELRKIALLIILLRAGLALDWKELKDVGRPAILMCFLPATFELAAVIVFAPFLLGISYLEAAVLGAVLAAVSPAAVVPRMLELIETGHGKTHHVPQLLLAGSSADNIYVIVLFTSFIAMFQGQGFSLLSLIKMPVSILFGLLLGIAVGLIAAWLFKKIYIQDAVTVLFLLGAAFLLVTIETAAAPYVPVSGLLAVMALGGTILKRNAMLAKRISSKLSKLWVGAELILFVLVGAAVDLRYISSVGTVAVSLLFIALFFRMQGVFFSLLKTKLNRKERLFSAIAYLPKATVQAAIGAIPLSLGMPAGNTIVSIAALSILVTAPMGAIGMDLSYKRLLDIPDKR